MKGIIASILIPVILFLEAGILYKLIQWFFEFDFSYANCMGAIAIYALFRSNLSTKDRDIDELLELEATMIVTLGLFFILMFLIYSII